MRKNFYLIGSSVASWLSALPVFADDASDRAAAEAASFVVKFNEIILYPTIALLSGVAFLVFLWGCFEYIMNANNDQGRQQGVKHITFGIIGLLVMITAWALLNVFAATFGLDDELTCADDPSAPECAGIERITYPTPGPSGT